MIERPALRLPHVVLALIFGILTILTWRRSGDLMIDWGRELYTALSVSEGRGIPLDVLYLFGPVSPLINGTVFRLAGERTDVLLVSNLVFLAVAVVLVYDIAGRLFGRRSAFLCSLVFLFLSGFPHLVRVGNYSFLTPYSHGLTHGLVLGFFALASLFRALERDEAVWWLTAGISTGLATGTKPEVGLATMLTLCCGMGLVRCTRRKGRRTYLLALAGLVASLGIMAYSVSQLQGISPAVVFEPYRSALRAVTLDYPFYSRPVAMSEFFRDGLVGFGGLLALTMAVQVPGRIPETRSRSLGEPAVSRRRRHSTAAAIVLFLLVNLRFPFAWLEFARTLPWVSAAALLTSARSILFKGRELSGRQLQKTTGVLLLSLFAAILLVKMGARTHFDHYGFALAAPACLLGLGLLCRRLPARTRLVRPLSRISRGIAPGIALFLVLSAATQSAAFYSRRTYPVGGGANRALVFPPEFDPRTQAFERTLRRLAGSQSFASGALILPEGSMLFYLLRTASSVPVASLMPLEIELLGPERIIDLVESANPHLVVIAQPDLSPWQAVDVPESSSYLRVQRWVESCYCETDRFGSSGFVADRFDIVFFETCDSLDRSL